MAVTCYQEPLVAVATALRMSDRDPHVYFDELWEHVDEIEPDVCALVDEDGRRERVSAEISAMVDRFDDRERPPLFCVPVGVKDIVHVQGILTRANSEVPPTVLTGAEATVVTRLREAGAVPMAKTVTTEFAYRETGPTRNPHDLAHTPGGSSSGSAAGVAAGLFPLAIGTQTGGSVLRPAAFCCIVGFKPTHGRIPTDGVLPISDSLDTLGLFTQDVEGTRLAASVICNDWKPVDDERPTLGVPDDAYLNLASDIGRDLFEGHIDKLEAAGYDVRQTDLFADTETVSEHHQTLMRSEMALSHREWYEEYPGRYGERTVEFIDQGRDESIETLAAARTFQDELRATIQETMVDAGVDCWIAPTAPGPAPEGIDSTGSSVMNRFWTFVGLPAISLPAGTTVDGLPVGLQCVAGVGEGERLLSWSDELRDAVV